MRRALALAFALGCTVARGDDATAMKRAQDLRVEALKKPLLAGYLELEAARRASTDDDERFYLAQFLGNFLTFTGQYARATDEFPIVNWRELTDVPSPLSHGYHAEDAADAIIRAAHARRAVFLNEAHTQPLTRTLAIRLLERLRRDGFTHLALESIDPRDSALAARGYLLEDSGPYAREPLYGDLVREALKLGYVVVPYESATAETDSQNERETAEARNLYERAFRSSPHARVLVHAGYVHIWESGELFGAKTMAQHFKRISGIDPLTIDQTIFFERGKRDDEHPQYDALAASAPRADAIALVDRRGHPWSAAPERYDMTIVFPRAKVDRGRPTWLALDGARRAVPVSAADCAGATPCLVEAHVASEPDDATPADRALLSDNASSTSLYLRPGHYRIASVSPDGTRTERRELYFEATP